MSTSRDDIKSEGSEDLSVTSFYGGTDRGRCLQLTQTVKQGRYIGTGYVQLDEDQAAVLALDILDWLDSKVLPIVKADLDVGPTPYEDLAARMAEEDES